MLRFCCFFCLFTTVLTSAQDAHSQSASRYDYVAYEQEEPYEPSRTGDIMTKFGHLSPQQLLDMADHYETKNIIDTALICYSLIINNPVKENDPGQQHLKIDALNKSAVIYYWMCDYMKSYDLLLKALGLCEKYHDDSVEFKVRTNIGNIYFHFKEYRMAKQYYFKALELCRDSASIMILHNNIAEAEIGSGELDSAFYHIKSLQASNRFDSTRLHLLLNTTASFYPSFRLYG